MLLLNISHYNGQDNGVNPNMHDVTNNVYEDRGKGNVINYVIPSFPVHCAKLVEVKVV